MADPRTAWQYAGEGPGGLWTLRGPRGETMDVDPALAQEFGIQPAAAVPSTPLGIEAPTITTDPAVSPSVSVPKQRGGTGAMQAFGEAIQGGATTGDAFQAATTTQDQAGAPAQEPQGPASIEGATFYQAPQRQAPGGPQFATATTTRRSTRRKIGIEDDLEQIDEAAQKQAEANENIAEAQSSLATKTAAVIDSQVEAREQAAAEYGRRRQETDQELDRHRADTEQLMAEQRQLMDEGYQSFWADKSTGTKIAALVGGVLGDAFGGALEGLTGSKSSKFVDWLDRIQERDLQLQMKQRRDKVEGFNRALGNKATLMDMARSVAQSDREAYLLSKNSADEYAQSQLSKLAATTEAEAVKERAAIANAQLQERVADRNIELAAVQETNVTSKRVPISGGGAAQAPGAQIVNPQLWGSLRATDKQKARDAVSAYRDIISVSQQMEQVRGEYGTEAFATEAAEKYKQLQLQLVGAMTTIMNSGVLNEGEFERYAKSTGGDLSPKFSDAQRVFTLGGIDPTLNAVRGFRKTIQEKAKRVGRDRWGIDINTGAASADFATAQKGVAR